MVDKENLRRQVDVSRVEGATVLCCMTGFACATFLILLDRCGRMLRNRAEGTSERPGIPTANSIDNVDKNGWFLEVGTYVEDKRTLDGHQLVRISVTAQGYDNYKNQLSVELCCSSVVLNPGSPSRSWLFEVCVTTGTPSVPCNHQGSSCPSHH
jgi:hypothetical protein